MRVIRISFDFEYIEFRLIFCSGSASDCVYILFYCVVRNAFFAFYFFFKQKIAFFSLHFQLVFLSTLNYVIPIILHVCCCLDASTAK